MMFLPRGGRKLHILWQIFSSFFKIGAFTIGGGYAMLPVMQKDLVERLGWLDEQEFMETVAVTQSAPGAIAVNTAIFIGKKMAGLPGVAAGCLGVVLPSFLIILAIAVFFQDILSWAPAVHFFAGVRPAVVALIAHVAWKMGRKLVTNKFYLALFIAALACILMLPSLHPFWIILGSGIATIIWGAQGNPLKEGE
jgi:chromate transporter